MSIRRIKVVFLDPDGVPYAATTGSVDRRVELVREARVELEAFKANARRQGDPLGNADFTLAITDAPAGVTWTPGG